MSPDYRFDFAWEGSYGHAVRLIEELMPTGGVVLDLGCGYAAPAEILAERGFEYVGLDLDEDALADIRRRGFEAHALDLRDPDLDGLLKGLVGHRSVAAALLLDSLEHLPDTATFLGALHEAIVALNRPPLVLSVPNVAHYDVGAKLVAGRWDVTPTGLLDATHLQFFTEDRLLDELGRHGWSQAAQDDVVLYQSDQHFPADHPVLVDGSPLHDMLLQLRQRVDETSNVNQFVRGFVLGSDAARPLDRMAEPAAPPLRPSEPAAPFLTVVVRTQGVRPGCLIEALTCLAAQSDESFEVIVMVHSRSAEVLAETQCLVGEFAPAFASRVHVEQVVGGGRARPLNVAIERAVGRYLAVLDDDDLVTADWVEAFAGGAAVAPGQVVRSVTVDRRVERPDGDGAAPYLTLGALEFAHTDTFDAVEHICDNRSPVCSLALPLEAVRVFGLHFDETLPVLEDWEFLLRLASVCGVHDSGRVTSIYHRWEHGASYGLVSPETWRATRQTILDRLDELPTLLPPGSARRIAALREELVEIRHRLHLETLARAAMDLRVEELEGSTFWRATAPLRRAADLARGIRRWKQTGPGPPATH